MNYKLLLGIIFISATTIFFSCTDRKQEFIKNNIQFASDQTNLMLKQVGEPTGKNYPRTINSKGELQTTGMYDWTPGFFPGTLWYLYELTNEEHWKTEAEKWTNSLEPLKTFTGHHDLGFMMYCSYGNAKRLAPKAEYDSILITSAASLASRYSENTKAIKSWNYRTAWSDTLIEWFYPVIIDNMMNLELLTQGSKLARDNKYKDIAVTHANTTLKYHFRDDYSSYHVVDYDTISGAVKFQGTCQGYADNSTWARGQAWAIYGYSMMYRETGIKEYLNAAANMADWYLEHLPSDLIPLWDFNVGQEGYTPQGKSYAVEFAGETLKDVSAAAVTCSALFELATFLPDKPYREKAIEMLHSLSSPEYRAELGDNKCFILKHSVGSIPHKNEIDVPLTYADYYYLEALVRYKNLK